MQPSPSANRPLQRGRLGYQGSRLQGWILVALGLGAALYFGLELARAPGERAAEIQRWEQVLAALADDRRLSVIAWLRSASVDARSIAGARRTEAFARAGYAAHVEGDAAFVDDMLDRFARPRGDSLAGLWIVGADGSVVASAPHSPAPDRACLEAATSADTTGRPGDIHFHGGVPVVPVAAAIELPGSPGTPSPGAALFAFDAQALYALLDRRPSQPNTLESYLVRNRDGRLEFLSPLLFGKPAAGAFDDPRLGARAAAEGRDTFSEGLDYRDDVGDRVLTVTRAIPGTDWGLAVEVDVAEALAPLGERVRARRVLAIGIWLGIFGLAFGAARGQRAAEDANRASEGRFQTLIENAPLGIGISRSGETLYVNEACAKMLGFARSNDLVGRSLREFWAPEIHAELDRRNRGLAVSPHYEADAVRRDGSRFRAEVHTIHMDLPDGPAVVGFMADVTERIRADVALRESERRFRLLSENAPIGIYIRQENVVTYANPEFERIFGYPPGEIIGTDALELVHPDDRPLEADRMRQRLAGGSGGIPARVRGVRKDGETIFVEIRGFVIDVDGRRTLIGNVLDVTAQERSREAIEQSELRFRTFIEKAPLAIGLSRDGIGVYANEKFLELWRYGSNDAVIGRSVLEQWAPHVRPLIAERVRLRALGLPIPQDDRLAQRSDGTMFPAHIETVAIELPDGPVTAAFITDVTERNRAEEALRESELRLRQIAEGIDQVVWLADAADSHFLYVSPAFVEVYGRAADELYADPGLRLAVAHADDAERVRAAMETKQARGDYDESYRIVRPDGTVRSIRDRAFPLRDADGQVYRIVGVSRDVTHERALLLAKEAAEHASRAKSSFLAHISHEIRTPMNAVLGYAQLLLRDGALGAAQRQKVGVIHSSGTHLLQILNDVLEMSKIEAGRVSLTAAPFDLRIMLDEVESMFKVLTVAKGVALAVECRPELPRALDADGGKVKQVVINLLSNALKFTDAGTISVRASSDAVAPGKHTVRIDVEDTGIGIDAEGLGRLFQTFEQLAAGARIGGTGLGLAISRNFAQLMGGDLTVRSTPGVGSVFTFTFEAKVAEAVLAGRLPRKVPMRIGAGHPRPKILVVDDVAANRAICDEMLSPIGFEIRSAASGEEAVAVHDAWRPDLVLMDLRMSGMDGFEATRRLRASGSAARIVALTASGLSDAEPAALAAGADLFLRKPFDEGDLLQRIGELLGLRYEYTAEVEPLASGAPGRQPLAELLGGVPPDLVRELRDAAAGARARRIEELAREVGEHSEAAATAIRDLVGRFRYDLILHALEPGAGMS